LLAIKEILDRAVAEPDAVAATLQAKPGVDVLHRSPDLTVISVLPVGLPATPPHDHRMWALVGIYGGQEDNEFFRRADTGLAESGGRSLRVSDTLAMGDDTIHAIRNPSTTARSPPSMYTATTWSAPTGACGRSPATTRNHTTTPR
jgi:predicted metal-dependent enzyme (double-stranded beta helix superfamily)